MAALSLIENANKENIPPFFSDEQVALLCKKPPHFSCNRRRVRKPLEDITNLVNRQPINSIQVPQYGIPVQIPSALACKVKSGKRKTGVFVELKYKKTIFEQEF